MHRILQKYPADGTYWGDLREVLCRLVGYREKTNNPNPIPDITAQSQDYHLPGDPENQEIVLKGYRGELSIKDIIQRTQGAER